MKKNSFDPAPILKTLKDFQKRTVEHVFRRLYTAKDPTRRFLVADEVGLGKTMVARGVVAKAIAHLENDPDIDRIDIVYVCSNAAIAQQNINRLNITGVSGSALASRLTLLPLELHGLAQRKLNFVSFTPGTTFDLKHAPGRWEERRLLYRILRRKSSLHKRGLMNLLRCGVSEQRWRHLLAEKLQFDRSITGDFLKRVGKDRELMHELQLLCKSYRRNSKTSRKKLNWRRNRAIGQLRRLLASSCVEALEPDLIILDEFQRFKELLSAETPAGELAHALMDYKDARVLLLSATPYRMLSLYDEEENHYQDFLDTLRFLLPDEKRLARIKQGFEDYRTALYSDFSSAQAIRDRLRYQLMRVMVRTERITATRDRDAMLTSPAVPLKIQPQDIRSARALDRVVTAVGARDAVEYWKSAPYLMNFMKDYDLKRRIDDSPASASPALARALDQFAPHQINKNQLQHYERLDPANARLRTLMDYTLGNEEWKLLWMPPALAYTLPGKAFAGIDPITKSIVFSSWSVVPDVISATCSYAVERERVLAAGAEDYFELTAKRKALLTFKQSDGRPDSMSSLLLLCPSPWLINAIDPLAAALRRLDEHLTPETLLEEARGRLEHDLAREHSVGQVGDGREDVNWYWAIMAQVDFSRSESFATWSTDADGWRVALDSSDDVSAPSAFTAHVDLFCSVDEVATDFGSVPADLYDVMAELALGSPTICAARALLRIAPDLTAGHPALLSAATRIGEGFRSLFNSPDVRSFLESETEPYWRRVLRYCIEGNLQAVLDEYLHFLKEARGLFDKSGDVVVGDVADIVHSVLSIRTSSLSVDEYTADGPGRFARTQFKMRCKYALRFADIKDDRDKVLLRAGVVLDAFNSPFRPFTLATTSIGQEGLDFHGYCHRVWHWNLPRNPVDMEQREGRVNRYKGHAVRKNVARKVELEGLANGWNGRGDPWVKIFDLARDDLVAKGTHQSDLTPYWLYDDVSEPAKVERLVPLPPFSSENSRLAMLKHSLTVYRLAFGQPRQQDLMEYLAARGIEISSELLRDLQLDLAPSR